LSVGIVFAVMGVNLQPKGRPGAMRGTR
jgi:hypothetical protein